MPGASRLTWTDYAILLVSLAVLLGIGARFARQRDKTADFFLARRHRA